MDDDPKDGEKRVSLNPNLVEHDRISPSFQNNKSNNRQTDNLSLCIL